ncbi:mannose-1-phosphate guanylyltransferase [soil metagenome]
MIVVIIAGGSGTRLWPLSTHSYPKHLLKLTNEKSLLQNTVDRVLQVTSSDKIFVIPEVSHAEHVYKQLENLKKENILIEPGRRGTASCFLLALAEIKRRGLPDEPILFLWADHLIRDAKGFAATMLKGGSIAEAEKRLVFIGVEPTYPSVGFGYMERDGGIDGWLDAYNLMSFKEKPDKKTAERYLASGRYLWNTGYLVGTLSTFEREVQTKSSRLWADYEKLQSSTDVTKTYLEFESEPIDTALSEKIDDGIVVPGTFDWADVGSFKDLHDISAQDDEGNHISGEGIELENTSNSYVRNDGDVPVAVIGLDNVVIVSTPNGILISNKNYAQKVGDIAKRLQS